MRLNVFVGPTNSFTFAVSTPIEKPNALPVRFLQASQWQRIVHTGRSRSSNRTDPHEQPPLRGFISSLRSVDCRNFTTASMGQILSSYIAFVEARASSGSGHSRHSRHPGVSG